MKVLIIGSGISGITTAIQIAQKGEKAILVSPMPSERSQSVMAAGGINASIKGSENSAESHIRDTMSGGRNIAGKNAVSGLCNDAPDIIDWLENSGVVFNRDENGEIERRSLGGHSYKRTVFAGASTGKQIMTALVQKAREYEKAGLIERRLGYTFYSGIIKENRCYGALFYSEKDSKLTAVYADKTVMATGGQNQLFGKTTGSSLCDGYAIGKLFMQGAVLKNLEFIQYHPTTIETPQKRMLISEAARGEGGRLYYEDNGKRVYFMEDMFGSGGNLMPRDIVSKCIYDTKKQVYLDVSFLGRDKISKRLPEIKEVCAKYLDLDITKKSIPVSPSVHFFMGGIAVDINHRTSIENLYAVGECASIYHGANRLGGNSLLSAIHSGRVTAMDILNNPTQSELPDLTSYITDCEAEFKRHIESESKFPAVYLMTPLENIMNNDMGITRNETRLKEGIQNIDYYISVCEKLNFDSDFSPYHCYRALAMLTLARAVLTCAKARKETRGSHIREDYPETKEDFEKCTLIRYNNGNYDITYESEDLICW